MSRERARHKPLNRFGNNSAGGDYRLLGFFEDNSPVLNIIGFDFDYSAYPHE